MGIEVRPLGVKCNLRCLYCYQHQQRKAGNVLNSYDLERIKIVIEKANKNFCLFGGDPLIMPEKDLEELLSWGFEHFNQNGIQTNGVLINDNHIRMFKKYKVNVGISVDGPDELNDARWNGTLEKTREATTKTHAVIEKLCIENLIPSVIVTLHRYNADKSKLPRMHDWFRHLVDLGIKVIRLHTLEVETEQVRQKLMLSDEENVEAFLSFYELSKKVNTLEIPTFNDIFNLLLGDDKNVTCCWTACDPYTTLAVQGIEGNGQRSNCTRVNKDGVDFIKSNTRGFERYISLYHTPQKYGGCQYCRFFLMCKGHCPGGAIDGDWRNKTEYCAVWKKLLAYFEKEILDRGETPLSLQPYREEVEIEIVNNWCRGAAIYITDVLNYVKQNYYSPAMLDTLFQDTQIDQNITVH